jgi:predicted lipid-binding transport protein (Tim44 family)
MKRKKIMAIVAAGLIAVSAAGMTETAEAAIGGMRAPRITTPRMNTPRPQAPRMNTPSPSQNARPNQQYRPSQRASDIPSAAPRAASPSGRADMNSVPYRGTRWGNMMRSMGIFAGGMMLGSLLGRMFGFGAGSFMGDLFGLLLNGLLIYFVISFLSRLWHSMRGGSTRQGNPYRQQTQAAPFPIPDIRPPKAARSFPARESDGTDYEPKRTADWYRSR